MVFISGVVLNGLMRSLFKALAGEGGPAGTAQWAECRAVRSPGKGQERLPGGSHVHAESSRTSRVSQTVREGGKGGGPAGRGGQCFMQRSRGKWESGHLTSFKLKQSCFVFVTESLKYLPIKERS